MIPDQATMTRMMQQAATARPEGSDRIAQALQLAILDAGSGGCACESCKALLVVQRELRASLRANLDGGATP